MKKLVSVFLILCLFLSALAGCNSATGGIYIQYEGNAMVQNVDPLLATSEEERMAVQQLYEPLVTMENGTVIAKAAEGYSVSDDGKTYTFVLRDNLRWSNGETVKAEDFVFNLQRAADPKTRSVCGSRLLNIQGVLAVQKGKQTADTIGVKAKDDKTLEICLAMADEGILSVLSGVAGMPCQKRFFESCGGRYGMGREYVLSNGIFEMGRWSTNEKDLYVVLNKNEHYWNKQQVVPAGAVLSFVDSAQRLTRIADEKTDCAAIGGTEVKEASDLGLKTISYYAEGYALLLNTKKDRPTADLHLRKALAGGVEWANLSVYLPAWCTAGESLMLPDQYCGSTLYTASSYQRTGLSQHAQSNFTAALQSLTAEQVSALELCYVEQEGVRGVLDFLVQCWQKQFGIYVTLTAVSVGDLEARMQSGEFDMVLCSTGNTGRNTLEVLEQFSSKGTDIRSGLTGKAYDKLLNKAKQAGIGQLKEQQACEDYLRNECIVVPLFYQKGYYACHDKVTALPLNSLNHLLDFSKVGKYR